MPGDRDEVITLLRELLAVNRAILAAIGAGPGLTRAPAVTGPAIANDRELDSQYGNPEVRGKDPHNWHGPTMKGRKYSECQADYLDLLAEFLDWQAGQAEKKNEKTPAGKPIAEYRRKDAARARGWAARVRAGKVPQGAHEPHLEPDPEFISSSDFAPSDDWMPANWK